MSDVISIPRSDWQDMQAKIAEGYRGCAEMGRDSAALAESIADAVRECDPGQVAEFLRTLARQVRDTSAVLDAAAVLTDNAHPPPIDRRHAILECLARAAASPCEPGPRQFVYFARAEECGRIKIGVSKDPPGRIKALSTASPEPVTLIVASSSMGPSDEKALHERFAHLNANGEWFHPGDDLLAYIETVIDVEDDVDEVQRAKLAGGGA